MYSVSRVQETKIAVPEAEVDARENIDIAHFTGAVAEAEITMNPCHFPRRHARSSRCYKLPRAFRLS